MVPWSSCGRSVNKGPRDQVLRTRDKSATPKDAMIQKVLATIRVTCDRYMLWLSSERCWDEASSLWEASPNSHPNCTPGTPGTPTLPPLLFSQCVPFTVLWSKPSFVFGNSDYELDDEEILTWLLSRYRYICCVLEIMSHSGSCAAVPLRVVESR